MSIPHGSPQPAAPPGWYPTGETGPDGAPVERWWDGSVWSAMVRPMGGGTFGPPQPGRSSRAKALISVATAVVVVGAGLGLYFGLHHSNSGTTTAQSTPQATGNPGLGGGNGSGGLGGGTGGFGGGNGSGGLGGTQSTPSPQPTVTGGSGTTISDPIDSLTIPVPSGWTGTSGSTSGEGSWPALATGKYTCPSALAQQNGTSSGSSSSTCTRGGVNFTTAQGTDAKSTVTSDIAEFAKGNYGTLSGHSVVSEGAITVAGRTGYQITWNVTPDYSGPSGTVQLIGLPDPTLSGYLTLIDIGVDKSSQAPSLSSVDSQIIGNITDSSAAGA